MGALVQYRDLPGGPTKLELCDELSRYCMCTNCGMLSMSMLEDTNNHAFCETCLKERSFRHHSDHIYCKYESKNVSIFEMFDANHLITVIRDQSVVCPNPECKEIVTLQNLKEHYMRCQKTVTCSTCQHPVQTTEWSSHEENCNKQESAQMQPQGARPKQIRTEVGRAPSKQSPSVKVDSNQNNGSFNSMYPSIELQKAQKLTSGDPEEKVVCRYCERNVKQRNMDDHVVKCAKAPQRCAYCEDDIKKEVLQSHQRECKKNPDNVHAQVPEKKKKAPNTQGACGFQAPGGESASYASVVKHGKHAGGNNSTGTSSQRKGTLQKPTEKSGGPRTKVESNLRPDLQQGEVPAGSPVWLQCLYSGDLLAAFAAFVESFSDKKMDEQFMYSTFTPHLVDTNFRGMVKDLLEKPCPTHPFYCLVVALFARASLPPKVWTKSKDKVTWNDVLRYLPSILVSRLPKRKVLGYLREYPVFLEEACTSSVVGICCGTKEHPPRTSNSSTSTTQASPANGSADPPANENEGLDASGDIKGNPSDGGDGTGEQQPPLHAEKRDLEQLLAHDEVENSDTDMTRAIQKRRKITAEARADAHQGIGSTEQVTKGDQLPTGTDEAPLLSSVSLLDGKPSSKKWSIFLDNKNESAAFKSGPIPGEKGLEESSPLGVVEGRSISQAISPKCRTSRSETTLFPSWIEDHFSCTADDERTAHKAENGSTSSGDAGLGKNSIFSAHSKNDHTPSITCEESEFSKGCNTNFNSATEGLTQVDYLSNASHVVSSPEEGLSAQANESTRCEEPHTRNETAPQLQDQNLKTHQKSLPPEHDENSPKCKTSHSQEPLLVCPDEWDFSLSPANAETTSNAKTNGASVGSVFVRSSSVVKSDLKEDRESLTESIKSESDNTANMTGEQSEDLTRLLADFRILDTGSTTEADRISDLGHVSLQVEEMKRGRRTPFQGSDCTKYMTSLTKKDALVEPPHEEQKVPPMSLGRGSALVTAAAILQNTRSQPPTALSDVGALRNKFDPTTCTPRFPQPRFPLFAGVRNLAAKEVSVPDTKSQQKISRIIPFKGEHVGSHISCPGSPLGSCGVRSSLALAASQHYAYSELGAERVSCRKGYPVGDHTEDGSSSESL